MLLALATLVGLALTAPSRALLSAPPGTRPAGPGADKPLELGERPGRRAAHQKKPKRVKQRRFTLPTGDKAKRFRQELTNFEDTQYTAPVSMGGQNISAIVDTGSIELVVFSQKCRYWCGNSSFFFNSTNSVFYMGGKMFVTLTYEAGTLRGNEAYDTFRIGPLVSEEQPFWEIIDSNMPVLFEDRGVYQAIIGLGPIDDLVQTMKHNADNTDSFAVVFETLNTTRYSLCLLPGSQQPGYITWNDNVHIDHANVFSQLRVIESGFWLLRLANIRLGDKAIGCNKRSCGAILDSGTSLIAAPKEGHKTFSDVIAGLNVNCDDMKSLPSLKFELDGVPLELPPDAYMAKVSGEPARDVISNWARREVNETCRDSLMDVKLVSDLGEVWIFGIPFFRSYYTVFVQSHHQKDKKPAVYIAPAGTDCDPVARSNTMVKSVVGEKARRLDLRNVRLAPWVNHTARVGRFRRPWGGGHTLAKQRRWVETAEEREHDHGEE